MPNLSAAKRGNPNSAVIPKVIGLQKPSRKNRAFFNFKANKFTKLARDYHNEIHQLTTDLLRINRKIQDAAALCHLQINFIKKKNSHLISPLVPPCFDEILYHIENFDFRVTGYRDKLVQFINQALRIGFDEGTMGILNVIATHKIVCDARLDTEIKKFLKDKDFKEILSERILLSHRRYYQSKTGYDRLLQPRTEVKSSKEGIKRWKENIQTKTDRANRVCLKVVDMNDRVMQKINDYKQRART